VIAVRQVLFSLVLGTSSLSAAQDYTAMEMGSIQLPASPTGAGLPNDGPTLHKLALFGRCIAEHSGRDILFRPPESQLDRRNLFMNSVAPEICERIGSFQDYAPMFLRGSYAERLLLNDFDLTTGKPRERLEKLFPMPTDAQRAKMSEPEKAALAFVEYGTCIAKMDMPGIARLMAAEVGSDAELQAFGALGPAMGQCLAPGMTLKINRFKLRGYLAEGAYRQLATAQVASR